MLAVFRTDDLVVRKGITYMLAGPNVGPALIRLASSQR